MSGYQVRPEVLQAMLEVWAEVDTVFTEGRSFDRGVQNPALGRIYRVWKRCRRQIGEPVPEPEIVFGVAEGTNLRSGRSTGHTEGNGREPA